jgi:hypothetical protein
MEIIHNHKKVELGELLHHGAATIISIRSGLSISTCSRVLRGQSNNPIAIKALQEYLSELAETKEKIQSSVEILTH